MITNKLKDIMKGALIATATWMIVFDLREKIIEVSPIKNTMLIGFFILVVVTLWDAKR